MPILALPSSHCVAFAVWSFSYNATEGGPECSRDNHRHWSCNTSAPPDATAVPVDKLYPPHTYNLLNPGFCYPNSNTTENTTGALSDWLDERGIACMAWGHCWKGLPNTTNDSSELPANSYRCFVLYSSLREVHVSSSHHQRRAGCTRRCGRRRRACGRPRRMWRPEWAKMGVRPH